MLLCSNTCFTLLCINSNRTIARVARKKGVQTQEYNRIKEYLSYLNLNSSGQLIPVTVLVDKFEHNNYNSLAQIIFLNGIDRLQKGRNHGVFRVWLYLQNPPLEERQEIFMLLGILRIKSVAIANPSQYPLKNILRLTYGH